MIFKKNTLNIIHGEDSINYLQNLIFSTKTMQKNKKLTLQYIYSQRKNNLQYWKDDLKRTVRLSFFDSLMINDEDYFIGSFSTINSIKEITRSSILETIDTNSYDIWFYDIIFQRTYNFYDN